MRETCDHAPSFPLFVNQIALLIENRLKCPKHSHRRRPHVHLINDLTHRNMYKPQLEEGCTEACLDNLGSRGKLTWHSTSLQLGVKGCRGLGNHVLGVISNLSGIKFAHRSTATSNGGSAQLVGATLGPSTAAASACSPAPEKGSTSVIVPTRKPGT